MRPRQPQRGGFTLIEILFTLVLLGVLISLATPAMTGWIRRTRMTAVLNQLVADIQYAKMLAVRSGQRVEVQVLPAGQACLTEYSIVVKSTPERVAKRTDVQSNSRGLCLRRSGAATVSFDSRGLPAPVQNRSFWIRHGSMRDSVTMSSMGRLYRFD
jgi:prepilin-type N-terminal cleavage/methylation domain-containing protein